jgi:orotidine-5'-phosphate decarboxylase
MKIIVALDCDIERAKFIIEKIHKDVDIFKVGPVMFVRYPKEILDILAQKELKVFLDLKLFDIPNTVKKTIENIRNLNVNVYSISLHIAGGFSMLESAKSVSGDIKLWGVSILTSIDEIEYAKLGYRYSLQHQVLHYARIAKKCNLDAIITSPRELRYLSKMISGIKFVTPSIRLDKSDDDQKRYLTPLEAKKLGSDYIVIGRPVTESTDPCGVIKRIKEMMNG